MTLPTLFQSETQFQGAVVEYASYEEYTSLWLRMALGRAQSILMHQVVKYAASASPSESEQT